MAGTDLTPYKDALINHDHTYHGNGCPQTWSGTSTIVCGYGTVRTWTGGTSGDLYQGEEQKIGTYYSYTAATEGTGNEDKDVADQTAVPDTFCPLGWQLPYSGKGGDYYNKSRSWIYLLSIYNITMGADLGGGPAVMSYPFDIIPSGAINIANGYLLEAHENGASGSANLWLSTMTNRQNADKLQVWWNTVDIRYFFKSYGLSLRCVIFFGTRVITENVEAKISSICVLCGPDATTWSA